jgi:hypothetical protein
MLSYGVLCMFAMSKFRYTPRFRERDGYNIFRSREQVHSMNLYLPSGACGTLHHHLTYTIGRAWLHASILAGGNQNPGSADALTL